MNLKQIICDFEKAGIENARFEAVTLASRYTGISRASLMCGDNIEFDSPCLAEAVKERLSRKPLQYILGEWEFMGLNFKVDESCLIPRQDTELLVEAVLQRLPKSPSFLDLCTGSGCIAVAIAAMKKDARGTAVEKYPDTVKTANKNAALNGVGDRIEFITGDVTKDIFDGQNIRFDAIVSNPPYVTPQEMDSLEPELKFEPRHALTDGINGLSVIEAIIGIYPKYLAHGGIIALEHGYSQGQKVRELMKNAGLSPVTLRDLSGNERVTFAKKD